MHGLIRRRVEEKHVAFITVVIESLPYTNNWKSKHFAFVTLKIVSLPHTHKQKSKETAIIIVKVVKDERSQLLLLLN